LSCSSKEQQKYSDESTVIEKSVLENIESDGDSIQTKEGRKLRYLFFANGGLIGYFDDGTVTGCPRCDLLDVNVDNMYNRRPHRTYIVQEDGSLLIDNRDIEYPREAGEDELAEWAMIDYIWIVEPERYKEE